MSNEPCMQVPTLQGVRISMFQNPCDPKPTHYTHNVFWNIPVEPFFNTFLNVFYISILVL